MEARDLWFRQNFTLNLECLGVGDCGNAGLSQDPVLHRPPPLKRLPPLPPVLVECDGHSGVGIGCAGLTESCVGHSCGGGRGVRVNPRTLSRWHDVAVGLRLQCRCRCCSSSSRALFAVVDFFFLDVSPFGRMLLSRGLPLPVRKVGGIQVLSASSPSSRAKTSATTPNVEMTVEFRRQGGTVIVGLSFTNRTHVHTHVISSKAEMGAGSGGVSITGHRVYIRCKPRNGLVG